DDRQLARGREVEVERAQEMAERGRRLRQWPSGEAEDADGVPLELVVAEDAREPERDEGEHRVAGRSRVIVELLLPAHELLAVRGRVEETASLLVAEQLDGEQRQPSRLVQPALLAGGDVQ